MVSQLSAFPYFGSFTAISTYVNILSSFQNSCTEFFILAILPYFFERLLFEIAKPVLCIFIKATWSNKPIPRNYGVMPEAPTVIGKFSFELISAWGGFFITAVFVKRRNQLIRIFFIIVNLGGFKPNSINANILSQFFYLFNLVFIWFYNEKLKNDKRGFALQFLFPFDYIPGSFQYFVSLPPTRYCS